MLTGAIVVGVVVVAGVVTGVAGFGFALVGTMALADVLGPRTAVAFMILPLIAANVSLARELDADALRTCGRRFAPFVAAALVGTLAGMALLDLVPERPLKSGLGILTLGFVVLGQDAVGIPGVGSAKERCFVESTPAMVGVGGVSGVVFGGTNVGVQMVAYVRSCGLSQRVFAGVVGLVFIGINGLRVPTALLLGMYPDGVLALSAAAVVPGVVGVGVGKRLRPRIDEVWQTRFVLVLLTLIGLRLVTSTL